MDAYLMDSDLDVWLSVEDGVKHEYDTDVKNVILKGLSDLDFDKVIFCVYK